MTNVTHILTAIGQGDPQAAVELLPLVNNELRRLAAQKLAQEASEQMWQATDLVHEAYLRLVAEIVKLRYFAGLSIDESGQALGLSTAAHVWLRCELLEDR